MDQFACVKAFIEIVECGSIHAAAKKLCQTDAAISKKLSKLEVSLQSQLLERGAGKQFLTEKGQHYYRLSKEAIEKLNYAESFIKTSDINPEGELTVLVSRYLFPELIAPKLQDFMRQYSALRLKFNTAERTVNFEKDKVDILFAIAMPPPNPENLIRRKAGGRFTRNVVCASPVYLEQYGFPGKPHDLLKHKYLCHSAQYPLEVISFDDGEELLIRPFLQFDETDTLIMAAKADLGFIAVKEFKITKELQSGELVEILPRYNQSKIFRYSYYRKEAYPCPKISAFLDFFS